MLTDQMGKRSAPLICTVLIALCTIYCSSNGDSSPTNTRVGMVTEEDMRDGSESGGAVTDFEATNGRKLEYSSDVSLKAIWSNICRSMKVAFNDGLIKAI